MPLIVRYGVELYRFKTHVTFCLSSAMTNTLYSAVWSQIKKCEEMLIFKFGSSPMGFRPYLQIWIWYYLKVVIKLWYGHNSTFLVGSNCCGIVSVSVLIHNFSRGGRLSQKLYEVKGDKWVQFFVQQLWEAIKVVKLLSTIVPDLSHLVIIQQTLEFLD